ncbi:MAG TPA: alpha/beta hydrolase family protein [Puia sp.]|jgi:S-formylglutathione hydrolase FrmB|nr:alpha/beta hydrolase family protein [Puia sp.]
MKCIFPLLLLSIRVFAGQADTILVHSPSMNKDIKCVVIIPENQPDAHARWPVIYLLHGHSGNYAQWPSTAPQLKQQADNLGILFVCPDGGYDSWYFDSPVDPSIRYETFMTRELIPYIDTHYRTMADRAHRAITGLSMGGHGALYLAIRHKDLFGAAGATSGGVDFRPFPNNWGIKKDLGDYATHQAEWEAHTVIGNLDLLHVGDLAIFFDCGVDDFFLTVNRNLHQRLLEKKIDHDYVERPGGHNGAYWQNSIDYQVLFFSKFFRRTVSPPSR